MIKLTFLGRPISKDNCKIRNKRGYYFLPAKYKQYEEDIQKQFNKQRPVGFQMYQNAVSMRVWVYFEDNRCLDLQNAPKSIFDALNGLLYKDDKQVSELHIFKCFDKEQPRIVIEAEEKQSLS
jgi:Holliday junction resolvase RusA-like endonuclease